MSITYDEALTYIWHVIGGVGDIVRFATPGLPDNNHLLLTLLSKLSVALFGPSEFALRLPSVLAYSLFCAAVAGILRRHLHGPLLVLFFLFTTLNPYVIDIMSVARGYGPGIALATSGFYALMRAARPGASRAVRASASLAAFPLAVLAHLSLLLFHGVALASLVGNSMPAIFSPATCLSCNTRPAPYACCGTTVSQTLCREPRSQASSRSGQVHRRAKP